MPVSLGDLPGAAQALLEQIEDALVTLQGGAFLPTDQLGNVVAYLAPGSTVAYDSAGLVVNLVTVRPGAPGQPISTFVHYQAMTQRHSSRSRFYGSAARSTTMGSRRRPRSMTTR